MWGAVQKQLLFFEDEIRDLNMLIFERGWVPVKSRTLLPAVKIGVKHNVGVGNL